MTGIARLAPRLAALFGGVLLFNVLTACAQSDPAPKVESTPVTMSLTTSAVAIFAGGCFWCMEPPFDKLPGVTSTISGYIGGSVANPTYEQVSAGRTGHAEALQVTYDPAKVSYSTLLKVFWRNVDPVAVDRQFCDIGDQYRSAIFAIDAEQRRLADASKLELQASGRFKQPIATEIVAASRFYPAEEYHQDYYSRNPLRYKYYRSRCGRDQRLEQVWGTANQ